MRASEDASKVKFDIVYPFTSLAWIHFALPTLMWFSLVKKKGQKRCSSRQELDVEEDKTIGRQPTKSSMALNHF